MDHVTVIRLVAGLMGLVVIGIIVARRKKRAA